MALPFIVLYNIIGIFWKLLGITLISFVLLWVYGLTFKESVGLSVSLSFIIGLIYSIKNEIKKGKIC